MRRLCCPLCEGAQLRPFLTRVSVPVHQNLVMNSASAAQALARGVLDLIICEACGFVFNRAFDLSLLQYGKEYDNTQSCSAYFDSYLDDLVRDMVENQGVRNCTIVEVGCGKGGFLKKLIEYPAANNKGYGFDPSYVGPHTELDGRLEFKTSFYDEQCADIKADVVVCRHVIEHIPQPLALLRAVRGALSLSPHARIFFETPCVEWILSRQVVWDLFYEHCSLFDVRSLAFAVRRAGFAVDGVRHVFGGQYLWLEARMSELDATLPDCGELVGLATQYTDAERMIKARLMKRLRQRDHGKTALWGGGAKGVTLANLVDPDGMLIDCVVDLNPNKQGGFVPGTGHPIVAPAALTNRGVRTAILMNPNYREEVVCLLHEAGIELELLDWSAE